MKFYVFDVCTHPVVVCPIDVSPPSQFNIQQIRLTNLVKRQIIEWYFFLLTCWLDADRDELDRPGSSDLDQIRNSIQAEFFRIYTPVDGPAATQEVLVVQAGKKLFQALLVQVSTYLICT